VGTRLVLGPDARPDLVLVAGGTGLAPMKALIEQVAAQGGDHRVHLFWGVRRQRELYDLPALRALVDAHAWLRVVPCVSDERPFGDEVEPGWAADVALRYGAGAGHEIYLCGSPDMVRGSREALGAAHVPPDRVHIEEFGDGEAFGGVADVPGFEVGPGAGNEETVR
jgi:NAD(P)H-flavin reductase